MLYQINDENQPGIASLCRLEWEEEKKSSLLEDYLGKVSNRMLTYVNINFVNENKSKKWIEK